MRQPFIKIKFHRKPLRKGVARNLWRAPTVKRREKLERLGP